MYRDSLQDHKHCHDHAYCQGIEARPVEQKQSRAGLLVSDPPQAWNDEEGPADRKDACLVDKGVFHRHHKEERKARCNGDAQEGERHAEDAKLEGLQYVPEALSDASEATKGSRGRLYSISVLLRAFCRQGS